MSTDLTPIRAQSSFKHLKEGQIQRKESHFQTKFAQRKNKTFNQVTESSVTEPDSEEEEEKNEHQSKKSKKRYLRVYKPGSKEQLIKDKNNQD